MMGLKTKCGQSLIEILIASAIAVILIGGAVEAITLSLRSSIENKALRTASSLVQELLEKVAVFTEADWHNIYNLTKSPVKWSLMLAGSSFATSSGSEILMIDEVNYERYFTVDNVERDNNWNIIESGGNNDPSTQFITVYVKWPRGGESAVISRSQYLTRSYRNLIFNQTDWSGGPGQTGPITKSNNRFDSYTESTMNISSTGSVSALITVDCELLDCILDSSIFDTGVNGGAGLQTIMWQGVLPGGKVKFKIASSNDPGSWNWGEVWYRLDPDVQEKLDPTNHNNKRYFRYRLKIDKGAGEVGPRVDDIVINYTP